MITKEQKERVISLLIEKGVTNDNAWYESGSTVFSHQMDSHLMSIGWAMIDYSAVGCMQVSPRDISNTAREWLLGTPEPTIIEATVSLKKKGDGYAATLVKGGVRDGGVFQIIDEPMAYVYADTDKTLTLGKVSLEKEDPRFDSEMCYTRKGERTFLKEGWCRLKVSKEICASTDEVDIPLCVEDFYKGSVTRSTTHISGREYRITIFF